MFGLYVSLQFLIFHGLCEGNECRIRKRVFSLEECTKVWVL